MILSYLKTKSTGLANLGNTCFMNTCLQIMSHTFELNEIVMQPNPDHSTTSLLFQWRELLVELWKRRNDTEVVVHPKKFLFYIQKTAQKRNNPLFTGLAQNDFAEFLHFFVNELHTSCKRPMDVIIQGNVCNETDTTALHCYTMLQKEYAKEYSEIIPLLYGVTVSELFPSSYAELEGLDVKKEGEGGKKEGEGGKKGGEGDKKGRRTKRKEGRKELEELGYSINSELFFTLDLPVSDTLCTSLDAYVEDETVQGWKNEVSGLQEDVVKKMRFWSLPPILTIALKRFTNSGKKDMRRMTYPACDLDMGPYICGYKKGPCIYDLYGIACHVGTARGGHYYALVQNAMTHQWYCYNDHQVTLLEEAQIMNHPHAYCLFYRLQK